MRTPRLALTVAAALAITIAGTGTACAGTAREGTFTALTYNVAGLPEPLSGSEPATNTVLISPLLNDYDLVLVQEDWVDPVPPVPPFDFYHDDLVSQVDHEFRSTPATPPLGTDPTRPSALLADGLNRLSRFPFGELTRVRWTNCFGGADTSDGGAADCLALKGFSVARTSFGRGVLVDVYNLHGEAGSTALDEQYRAEDYGLLADFMATYSAGRPVIVGGDFNLHTDEEPDSTVYDTFLEATGLHDVCEVVDCGPDADEIDKFAYRSGGAITIEPLSHRFEREKFRRSDGAPLSDHDALAVTFRWSLPTGEEPSSTTTPSSSPALVAQAPAVRPNFAG